MGARWTCHLRTAVFGLARCWLQLRDGGERHDTTLFLFYQAISSFEDAIKSLHIDLIDSKANFTLSFPFFSLCFTRCLYLLVWRVLVDRADAKYTKYDHIAGSMWGDNAVMHDARLLDDPRMNSHRFVSSFYLVTPHSFTLLNLLSNRK